MQLESLTAVCPLIALPTEPVKTISTSEKRSLSVPTKTVAHKSEETIVRVAKRVIISKARPSVSLQKRLHAR